jgi:hypothetical protein
MDCVPLQNKTGTISNLENIITSELLKYIDVHLMGTPVC